MAEIILFPGVRILRLVPVPPRADAPAPIPLPLRRPERPTRPEPERRA